MAQIDPVLRELSRRDDMGTGVLPDLIAQSWQRCASDYNLSPDRIPSPEVLEQSELLGLLEERADLLRYAAAEVDSLYLRLAEQNYMVSLAGPEGAMLLFRCGNIHAPDLARRGVLPGAVWREELQGTNGIGTGLRLGRSVIIEGAQHFGHAARGLTCITAPVHGPGGRIDSILNVTTARPAVDERVNAIVQGIVSRSAQRIEAACFLRAWRGGYMLRISLADAPSDLAEDGYLALAQSGEISDMTNRALVLLQRRRGEIAGLSPGALLARAGSAAELVAGQPLRIRWEGKMLQLLLLLPERIIDATSGRPPATAVGRVCEPREDPVLPPPLAQIIDHAERLARAGLPVLFCGESGTGKTTLADCLARKIGSHVPARLIDCARPEASQALAQACQAQPCALIIDRADLLSDHDQNLLCSLIDGPEGRHLLVLTASQAECQTWGTALRNRLSHSAVELAPLRRRPELGLMLQPLFARQANLAGRSDLSLSARATEGILRHHWPGNFHELQSAMRRAIAVCRTASVDLCDFQDLSGPVTTIGQKAQGETARLKAALAFNNGNVSLTARYLGISRAKLYRRLSDADRETARG